MSAMRGRSTVAIHLLTMLYGHWAANDPRGSGSTDFIDSKFEPLGPIHQGRKPRRLQPSRDDLRAFHREHEALLNFPVFWIDEATRQAIADAFGEVINRERYTVYACSICSNHAHLVIRIHRDNALTMWNVLTEASRLRLRLFGDVGLHHPVWSDRPYKVFLYTPDDVRRCISYVQDNPMKERLPEQRWSFVAAYDGWPVHKHRKIR